MECCTEQPHIVSQQSDGDDKMENNDWDDAWSDDDLFMDNSFLIEATQNPEKFFNNNNKDKEVEEISAPKINGKKISSYSNSNLTAGNNHNKVCSAKETHSVSTSASSSSTSSPKLTVNSVKTNSFSNSANGSNTKDSNSYKFVSVCKPSSSSAVNKTLYGGCSTPSIYATSSSTYTKPQSNLTSTSNSSTRPAPVANSFHQTIGGNKFVNAQRSNNLSIATNVNKSQSTDLKSPFRKSLSFDVGKCSTSTKATNDNKKALFHGSTNNYNNNRTVMNPSNSRPYQNEKLSTFSSNRKGLPKPNLQSNSNMSKSILDNSTAIQSQNASDEDLFDSSLSDEMLLQATLSEDFEAVFCGSSQPLPKTNGMQETSSFNAPDSKSCGTTLLQTSKPRSSSSTVWPKQDDIEHRNVTSAVGSLMLSPVRPAKGDVQGFVNRPGHLSSPGVKYSYSKNICGSNVSAIPSHVIAFKHKSPEGIINSSTPVKCPKVQDGRCLFFHYSSFLFLFS